MNTLIRQSKQIEDQLEYVKFCNKNDLQYEEMICIGKTIKHKDWMLIEPNRIVNLVIETLKGSNKDERACIGIVKSSLTLYNCETLLILSKAMVRKSSNKKTYSVKKLFLPKCEILSCEYKGNGKGSITEIHAPKCEEINAYGHKIKVIDVPKNVVRCSITIEEWLDQEIDFMPTSEAIVKEKKFFRPVENLSRKERKLRKEDRRRMDNEFVKTAGAAEWNALSKGQ